MRVAEILRILKWQTPVRIINAVKLVFSFYLSRIVRRPVMFASPWAVSLEPASFCNLGCSECPVGMMKLTREIGQMNLTLYKKIIDQSARKASFLTLFFQGEPYLNKYFIEMVQYAISKKMYVSTSTNGHFFSDEKAKATVLCGLQYLIVSVDGTSQEIYEKYRQGGTLENVLEGIKRLVKWKKELKSKTPHIVIQFLVMKHNEHQIKDIFRLGKELGVDEVKLKSAQIYDLDNAGSLIPSKLRWSRYRQGKDGKWKMKWHLYNHCFRIWSTAMFTWDGQLLPCCFDKDSNYSFGNISEKELKRLWLSDEYHKFRSGILKERKSVDICHNCTEGIRFLK